MSLDGEYLKVKSPIKKKETFNFYIKIELKKWFNIIIEQKIIMEEVRKDFTAYLVVRVDPSWE